MAYNKPWKSYQEQLDQLIDRGLIVTDTDKTLHYLGGYRRLGTMELVMPHTKETGKKKPLSSFATEVTLPKGGVLARIIVRLWQQSNLVTSKQSSILHVYSDINPLNYILMFFIKNYQYIESLLIKYILLPQRQSATMAGN